MIFLSLHVSYPVIRRGPYSVVPLIGQFQWVYKHHTEGLFSNPFQKFVLITDLYNLVCLDQLLKTGLVQQRPIRVD
jgi:hypothetical protein